MQYWLVKTEPETYSWDDLLKDPTGMWDGVRNVVARNNLRAMKQGDLVFVYHTGKAKEIMGIARVVREGYPDPTNSRPIWTAVDLKAELPLKRPVTLKEVKASPDFASCLLVRTSRLSVMPIEPSHFEKLLALAETKPSALVRA